MRKFQQDRSPAAPCTIIHTQTKQKIHISHTVTMNHGGEETDNDIQSFN